MKKLILTIISFIIFYSCTSVEFINIDTREPAPVTFESGTRKILIVDNSFKPIVFDSLSAKSLSYRAIDSVRPLLLNTFARFMNEEKIFDTVEIYPYYPKPLYKYYKNDSLLEYPLTPKEIQKICLKTNSDALISLDFIRVLTDSLSSQLAISNIDCIFRGYSANGDKLHVPSIETDTIVSPSYAFIQPYKQTPLMTKSIIHYADMLVDYFVPRWETEERIIFHEQPDNVNKAIPLIQRGSWAGAALIWEEQFENTKNNNKKAKFASNIALAHEITDNLDDASEWINIAYDLLPEKNKSEYAQYIREYKKHIEERLKKAVILSKQLNLQDNISDE